MCIRDRLRKHVDAVMDAGGQSFLETQTVDKKSKARYDLSLKSFLGFAEREGIALETGKDWDEGLVQFMNRQYFEGHQAYIGEVLICAVMDRMPEFSKGGHRSVHRAWKCVKGWRRLTPAGVSFDCIIYKIEEETSLSETRIVEERYLSLSIHRSLIHI